MLRRQATILALLNQANRPLTQTMLVKWAFLLRHETVLRDDRTFYSFVPYKHGPFSFALYRELAALERHGFIDHSDEGTTLAPATRHEALAKVEGLSAPVQRAVRTIVSQYGGIDQRTLLRRVYERYPWYASKSELHDLVPGGRSSHKRAPIAVYTIGYEGRSIDEFLNCLLEAGIVTILDVRATPVSRKYGFARRSLSDIVRKLGLEYEHWPTLGIESADRRDLSDFASYQRLLRRYEAVTLPNRMDDVRAMATAIQRYPSALLCAERDFRYCHRGRLAATLAAETGLETVHF